MRGTHNPADVFTKALPAADHLKHIDLILSGIQQLAIPKPSGRRGVPEPEITGPTPSGRGNRPDG